MTIFYKISKWFIAFVLFIALIILSQFSQYMKASNSVITLQVDSWVGTDVLKDNMLKRYMAACAPKMKKREISLPIEAPISHEDCAKSANAAEVYAVINQAKNVVEMAWPLNIFES